MVVAVTVSNLYVGIKNFSLVIFASEEAAIVGSSSHLLFHCLFLHSLWNIIWCFMFCKKI